MMTKKYDYQEEKVQHNDTSNNNEHIVKVHSSNDRGESITLEASLTIPNNAKGIVLFAHGSGSSRHSTRNRYVAQVLNNAGISTLLIDLLTPEEEEFDLKAQRIISKVPGIILNKFNIRLLAKRLIAATDWIITKEKEEQEQKEGHGQQQQHNADNDIIIGYFGASTGAAAALVAAAQRPNLIAAIVSRGGRPDLAGSEALSNVRAPTLLIVGGSDDKMVIDLNNKALKHLIKVEKKKLVLVPNATHLFEEPGTLEEVAWLASGWFGCYFLIRKHGSSSSSIIKQ